MSRTRAVGVRDSRPEDHKNLQHCVSELYVVLLAVLGDERRRGPLS